MNAPKLAENLLAQIAQIKVMERGKLSTLRETSASTAIKGHRCFQELTERYAQLKIEETRAAIAASQLVGLSKASTGKKKPGCIPGHCVFILVF